MLSVYILLWLSIDIHRYKQKNVTDTRNLQWCAHAQTHASNISYGLLQRILAMLKFCVLSMHINCHWLVVDLPLWKIWKSVGAIIPNVWENKKCSKHFQTTNQISIVNVDFKWDLYGYCESLQPRPRPRVKASSMARLELQAHTATSHGIWTLNKWLKCLTHDLLSYPSFTNIPATCPVSTSNPCEENW